MLTRSKKRALAGICRLVTLPAAVLRSIGSFLTTYECFVTVRACKNNEGLKPLLTSIEKIKVIRDNVLSGFVSVIEPSLISSIGCSVKVLEVQLYRDSGGALLQLLPRLGSLQHFQIRLQFYKEMRLVEQVFRSIPQRVRCLTLGSVDADALRYLGEAATTGCLPVLEELAFPFLNVQTVEDMAGLQMALMAPSLGKNLKKLSLDFWDTFNHMDWGAGSNAWRLLESVLHVEDKTHGILSRLETLVFTCFTGWGMLAEYLLHGERLPGLKEVVYSPDEGEGRYAYNYPGIAWYEMDSQVCRSWFELLHRRPLQTFNRRISFFASDQWCPGVVKERILELLRGLSNRALKPKCVAAIKEVDLTRKARKNVCSDTFEGLAGTIRLGNLRSVESLALGANNTTCTSQSLASFGKALDRAFLPCLTSFSFGMEEGPGNLRHVELEEWSLLLKSFFGSIPNGGLDGLQKFELRMPFRGTGMLLGALAEARPNCFRHLPELCLSELSGKRLDGSEIMEKMALVFEAGIFPCVERVKISSGEDEVGDLSEGMPRLLCALSDHTIIKELHVEEFFDYEPLWRIARPLLESMLTSLSVSTSPAFFPSLQILKFTIGPYYTDDDTDDGEPRFVYSTDDINRLLLSIEAVRPPNLKTIILGEIGGEKSM